MSACCACAKCQCACHQHLTPKDCYRMTQEALLGERLDRVATRWHISTTQLRQIIAYSCGAMNPTRYAQHREAGGKILETLRIYAADYGFKAAPKYAAWRREREETPDA